MKAGRWGRWGRWKAGVTGGLPLYPLAVLFGLNMVDELDRTALGVLLPNIRDHFGLDTGGILTVVALSPREGAMPLEQFAQSPPDRVALLVGTEGPGLTGGAEAAADVRVGIPIRPEIDSLNLAVATGIALSRLARGL